MKYHFEGEGYNTILAALREERVFSIKKIGDSFRIREQCDLYFELELTKEQLLELAEEIKQLAAEEEPKPPRRCKRMPLSDRLALFTRNKLDHDEEAPFWVTVRYREANTIFARVWRLNDAKTL